MKIKVVWQEIPTYGDLMPLPQWIANCREGCFIDYDGFGNLSDGKEMSNITVVPSNVFEDKGVPEGFTHIVWFNR